MSYKCAPVGMKRYFIIQEHLNRLFCDLPLEHLIESSR